MTKFCIYSKTPPPPPPHTIFLHMSPTPPKGEYWQKNLLDDLSGVKKRKEWVKMAKKLRRGRTVGKKTYLTTYHGSKEEKSEWKWKKTYKGGEVSAQKPTWHLPGTKRRKEWVKMGKNIQGGGVFFSLNNTCNILTFENLWELIKCTYNTLTCKGPNWVTWAQRVLLAKKPIWRLPKGEKKKGVHNQGEGRGELKNTK